MASLTTTTDEVAHMKMEETTASVIGTEALKDTVVGAIAGMIGKTIEYPFDTVKVRLQSQPDHLPTRYAGPLDCFRRSYRAEGIPGLYRGVSAPLFGAAIEASSLFFSYRIAQTAFRTLLPQEHRKDEKLPLRILVACGGASGAFTSLLLTPIELVKCQMQVPLSSSSLHGGGPISIVSSIFQHNGIFGFWHGQLGTLIRETGGSAAWFGSYECVSALFRRYNARSASTPKSEADPRAALVIYQQLLAGATAGVLYNFLFYPADTIKSRMQTEEVNARAAGRTTFWASGKGLWRQQGIRGMYRGCGITVGRAAPSSALMFAVYEGLMGWWG
jgi:ornithine carrier protein